ncbi:hypothetical protein ECZU29_45990 [Escherichia coli]|nr:hypothetical protein ECZU29_45990 [Escherichia coli]
MGTTRWEKRNIAEEIPIWKRNSVPNVTTASLLAHTQLFAQKWYRLKRWKTPRQPAFAGCKIA